MAAPAQNKLDQNGHHHIARKLMLTATCTRSIIGAPEQSPDQHNAVSLHQGNDENLESFNRACLNGIGTDSGIEAT